MTYAEFRKFGWVSPLSEVVKCKGPKEEIKTAGDITQRNLAISSEQSQREAQSYKQMQDLLAPLIGQQTALAAGSREEALKAAMPVISKLSEGWQGAKQNIMNYMPPGAARDRALADLSTQMYSNIGGAQAGLVQEAPNTLAGLGMNIGNYGLQQLGSSLAALQGGEAANNDAMRAKVESQKAWLNFFSNLAGAAGGAVTGGLLGGKPKSAGLGKDFVGW